MRASSLPITTIATTLLATAAGAGGAALLLWIAHPVGIAAEPAASIASPAPSAATRAELRELSASLDELARRMAGLEQDAARTPDTPAPDERTAESSAHSTRTAEARDPGTEPGPEELRAMLGAVLGAGAEEASPEDEARFWELARTSGALAELIAALEAEVESRPNDASLRLELAQAYVARLLTLPGGPERGIWGARAEEQWREAARIDPASWEAHFALGENFSYYPPFLDKSGEAVAELSRARELQEQRLPEPRFVETYVLLARTHRARGEQAEARAVLEAGLLRHPEEPALVEALAALPDSEGG